MVAFFVWRNGGSSELEDCNCLLGLKVMEELSDGWALNCKEEKVEVNWLLKELMNRSGVALFFPGINQSITE